VDLTRKHFGQLKKFRAELHARHVDGFSSSLMRRCREVRRHCAAAAICARRAAGRCRRIA
jgi:hypothetical protein